MNTTNKQDETLEEAIYQFYPERLDDYVTDAERNAFANGANWQKEQDMIIIDKLMDALGNTLSILEKGRNYIGVSLYKSYAPYYDKAKELLQSLK